MPNRFATLTAVCMLIPVGVAPLASAEPPPDPAVEPAGNAAPPPPPNNGAVPPAAPGVLDTPDGWHLTVSAVAETQLPVAPLTTSLASREYLVGGTFAGAITGSGKTELNGGKLEAGYQIGCGITQNTIETLVGAGITPSIRIPFAGNDPSFAPNLTYRGRIDLRPGTVSTVAVDEKEFEGKETRVTITGFRIGVDQCAGQSFIRSYATLTSSTENTEDVITYLGVTKAV